MLLGQEFSGCCSTSKFLLDQHLDAARAEMFLLQQKLKFRPLWCAIYFRVHIPACS
ncbi:hypothetical protein DPMN_023742 [Dreissena polymorpha]|uniref:Uncharacterized protein n=1 Tax=Dreissena polymorpha TaxID=45954 RepID=A0A9D4RB03_DREPO|nr:hypothetical protein DPMN_023742 [Dreissena polymorpha]